MPLSILDLPTELLLAIFTETDLPSQDVYSLALVCRRLHFTALPVYFSRHGLPASTRSLQITMRADRRDLLAALQMALFNPPLDRINFVFSHPDSDSTTLSVAPLIEQLRRVEAFFSKFTSIHDVSLDLDDKDRLSYMSVGSDEALRTWAKGFGDVLSRVAETQCTSLTVLHGSYFSKAYELSPVGKPASMLGRLVSWAKISTHWQHPPEFRRVPQQGVACVAIAFPRQLSRASNLTCIHVHSATLILPPGLSWTLGVLRNSPISQLTFANILVTASIWETVLPLIASAAPDLTCVRFFDLFILPVPGVMDFVALLPRLVHLDISTPDDCFLLGYSWLRPGQPYPPPPPRLPCLTHLRIDSSMLSYLLCYNNSIRSLESLTVVYPARITVELIATLIPLIFGDMTLARPVLPVDWDRALTYACRVRKFKFDDRAHHPGYPGTADFLETLRLCVPGHRLFPNIRSLGWYSYHEETLPYVRLFLGPRLTFLGLEVLQSAAHLSLLPIVATQCPLLRDVYVSSGDDLVGLSQTTSILVLGLSHLRVLTIPTLDNDALKHLARLPYLTELELEAQSTLAPFSTTASTCDEVFFPSLSSFVAGADDVDGIVPLFPLLSHAPLTRIDLNLREMTSASATARCLREMALHCTKGHSSLTELTLLIPWRRDTNPMAADFHTYSVCSAQLLPLLSFTNLQTVFLASPVGFDLDDSMVADMARAWPRVKLLYLFSSRSPRNAPLHVTLGGLLPLAQFCPQLSDLMISLDASVLPPKWQTRRKAAQRVSQSCFHDLSVKHSPVGEPLAVAAFLSSIFPALSGVRTDWDYEFRTEQELLAADPERAEELEPYKRWNAVSAALKALRMVRAEERYWTRRKERE